MPLLYSRRDFLKIILKATALLTAIAFIPSRKLIRESNRLFAEPIKKKSNVNKPDLLVVEGKDYKKLIRDGFKYLGGINKFVKPGDYVVIKPNASWSRTPEEAGNTHPVLVAETVRLCLEAGARKVDVIDHTCDNWKSAFKVTGIANAVKKAGGNMTALNETNTFTKVNIENGKKLKKAKVADQVLNADCFINMPIAKHHSAAGLTMSMKNNMGVVKNRMAFHMKGLHQCIADISSFVKPDLIIMDCTRILLTNGPKGPGEVKVLNKVVFGKNQVAVDSLGATYFGLKPSDIGHIKIANEMGLGSSDIGSFNILKKAIP